LSHRFVGNGLGDRYKIIAAFFCGFITQQLLNIDVHLYATKQEQYANTQTYEGKDLRGRVGAGLQKRTYGFKGYSHGEKVVL
jgi:hypothetical protein